MLEMRVKAGIQAFYNEHVIRFSQNIHYPGAILHNKALIRISQRICYPDLFYNGDVIRVPQRSRSLLGRRLGRSPLQIQTSPTIDAISRVHCIRSISLLTCLKILLALWTPNLNLLTYDLSPLRPNPKPKNMNPRPFPLNRNPVRI